MTPSIERTTIDGNPLYKVPEDNIPALTTRVEKLNRRAAKLGMPGLTLTEHGEEFLKRTVRTGGSDNYDFVASIDDSAAVARGQARIVHVRLVLVALTGTCPVVNGWRMAATIQHEDGGNVLRTVPGFERMPPQRYRTAETACEHCGLDRRRNDTYVLTSETGEWKQVGRNCLADFLRSSDASGLAEYAEILAGLDDEMRSFEESDGFTSGQRSYFSALELLTQVACCIRADGWCSRGAARDSFGKVATVDDALCCMDGKWFSEQSVTWQEKHTATRDDRDRAGLAIAWAQALPADVTNDYLWNIRVVSQRELISGREAGLAGSIIAAYNRAMEQETARRYAMAHPSEWFGVTGERSVMTLTVTGERDLESQWGLTTLVMMTDANGNKAKWFCSGRSPLTVGETYTVKATVKEHQEYKGSHDTLLSRVTVYDAQAAKAARMAKRQSVTV